MKKKSKFITFILSFLPGLAHIYVGYRERAIIFFVLFIGAIFGIAGLSNLLNTHGIFPVLGFFIPLIWFISLVDALSLVEKPGHTEDGKEEQRGIYGLENRSLITVALSFIPGAGHMYLGLLRQGLQLMSIFFFAVFFMGWLNFSLFLFVLPVIWFYSLFDAYHRSQEGAVNEKEGEVFFFSWLSTHPTYVGWGLIALGLLVIFERIISPMLNRAIHNFMQTGIVALILIYLGIRLIIGKKTVLESKEEETARCASTE